MSPGELRIIRDDLADSLLAAGVVPETVDPATLSGGSEHPSGTRRDTFTDAAQEAYDRAKTLRADLEVLEPVQVQAESAKLAGILIGLHRTSWARSLELAELYAPRESTDDSEMAPEFRREVAAIRLEGMKECRRELMLVSLVEAAQAAAKAEAWRQVQVRMGDVLALSEPGADAPKSLPLLRTAIDRRRLAEFLKLLKHPDPGGELRRLRDDERAPLDKTPRREVSVTTTGSAQPVEPAAHEPASHQVAALPLHKLIVVVFGLLALACICGGVYAIYANAQSSTEFSLFGAKLTTAHVGVAFIGIGLLVAFFTVRSVLRNTRDLAALPLDRKGVRTNRP